MSQTIARLTSPAQLVAALPHWLGFQPAESLVVLCLHEPRGRLGLTMRYDLPARQHEPELVAEVLVRVRHERATRVALVVLTEDPAPRVRGDLVDALVAGVAPLPVTDGVLVRGDRFWSYLCTQERCCPAAGTPVRSGAMTRSVQLLAAETVLSGRPVLPSRRELEALLAPPSFLASSAAAQRLEDAGTEHGCALFEQGLEPFRRRCVDRWRAVLDRWSVPPARLDDQEAAELVVALDDVIVRDQVAAWSAGRSEPLQGLLQELCRRTPPPYDAPVCTLFAWVTYAAGAGAMTTIALDRALSCEPEYPLAVLLAEALQRQVPPAQIRKVMQSSRAA
jgi:hypothetical protein